MDKDAEAQARVERYYAAKAEWKAIKAARGLGLPEPDAPNLEALEAKVPLVTQVQAAMAGQADDLAARRSAAARKAWETRRANSQAAR